MGEGDAPRLDLDAIRRWNEFIARRAVEGWDPTVFEEYRSSPAWPVVDRALAELSDNQDIVEAAVHDALVGHIVRQLETAGVVARPAEEP
jgi:hypothetical protein